MNVLEFIGIATLKDQLTLISPWVENGSVPEFLRGNPDADRYGFCKQLANVVAYLHDIDVVHGDIKGANILVSSNMVLKLTDFGNSITRENVMGFLKTDEEPSVSLRWTPPEILSGETGQTREGDVWSLGMTMLEIVTGNVPFAGKGSELAVFASVMKKVLPELPQDDSDQGTLFSMCLRRCWIFTPQKRITAAKVQTMLSVLEPA